MIFDRNLRVELAYYRSQLMGRSVAAWIAGERFPVAIFY